MTGAVVLLDLDDTLTDRARTFEEWAVGFLRQLGRPVDELEELRRLDNRGLTDRRAFFGAVAQRLGVTLDVEAVLSDYRARTGHAYVAAGIVDALGRLRASGGSSIVVTNGQSAVQRAKLDHTGLAKLVDRVVISEEVGVVKPDPRIFAIALDGLADPADAWMVGDNLEADILGAARAGLSTAWVSNADPPPTSPIRPEIVCPTAALCIDEILARPL
jgi:HAD superfamily hydrolase (TIGR01549 family)